MKLSVKAVVRNAVLDVLAQGYENARHDWAWWILLALRSEKKPSTAKQSLQSSYKKASSYQAARRIAPHISQSQHEQIQYRLADQLAGRIRTTEDIINMHRQAAEIDVQRRFEGWASSNPNPNSTNPRIVVADIVKPVADIKRKSKAVIKDQSHKMLQLINNTIAIDSNAIAGIWHSNFREPDYNYRDEHKEHDIRKTVFLLPNNWATKAGLAKKTKDVQPGELPYCACSYGHYLYKLKDIPERLLTELGKQAVKDAN